jgi:hypothetical protein
MAPVNENRSYDWARFSRDFSQPVRSSPGWDTLSIGLNEHENKGARDAVPSKGQLNHTHSHSVLNTQFLVG